MTAGKLAGTPEVTREKRDRQYLQSFTHPGSLAITASGICVKCPSCEGLGIVTADEENAYFRCTACGAGNPCFRLELWYLASYNNKPVWAVNREHLDSLIVYLDEDLREKPDGYRAAVNQGADGAGGRDMERQSRYFEEALSNMVFDAADGGAVRHLVGMGYSVNQIMERLAYPISRSRVEDAVYRCMTEKGIILETLPLAAEKFQRINVMPESRRALSVIVRKKIAENGEAFSYVLCPCERWKRLSENKPDKTQGGTLWENEGKALSNLTSRERDYLLGIPWQCPVMFHRMTARMTEITIELALQGETVCIYFLNTKERLKIDG